jgi:hypothetical protein
MLWPRLTFFLRHAGAQQVVEPLGVRDGNVCRRSIRLEPLGILASLHKNSDLRRVSSIHLSLRQTYMLPQRTRVPLQHAMLLQPVLNLLRQNSLVHKRRSLQPLDIRIIRSKPIHNNIPRRQRIRIRDLVLSIVTIVWLRGRVVCRSCRDIDGIFAGLACALAFSSATVLLCKTVFWGVILSRSTSSTTAAKRGLERSQRLWHGCSPDLQSTRMDCWVRQMKTECELE